MNGGSGSIEIVACRTDKRTVLERVRYDGIARCSRAFARGEAAYVMLSQLGPGVMRGDRTTLVGHVRAGAHLVITNQAATRLLGGGRAASAAAAWTVAAGARLELIGEPLIAATDASYATTTTIELERCAHAVVSDIACVPAAAAVHLRTIVRRDDRELLYDAVDAAATAPRTVGSLAVIGVDANTVAALVVALDSAADRLSCVRAGVGSLAQGAFVRIIADDIWTVRSALLDLRRAACLALPAPNALAA